MLVLLAACSEADRETQHVSDAGMDLRSFDAAESLYGLDERSPNPSCKAPPRPTGTKDDPFPQKLSDTGCFDAADLRRPVAGVIPFDVNAPLWSDGAVKRRFLSLPDGGKIAIGADGDFLFPVGTILLKTFELRGRMLETRFLIRHEDGEWAGYTYAWDDAPPGEARDATLLPPSSESRMVGNEIDDPNAQLWIFPSRANCLECHTAAAGRALGPEIGQINRDFVYPGGRSANQIRTWDHIGLFEKSPGDPASLTKFPTPTAPPDPARADDTAETRARAYLHANCSHCHRPDGAREVMMDLRFSTSLQAASICNTEPNKGNLGLPDARLMVPGNPALSLMTIRMSKPIPNVRMPQIGTTLVDDAGLAVVEAWIKATVACPGP